MSQALNLTDQYLTELSLKGVRENLSLRIKEALDGDLGYEDLINLILFDELQYRKNQRREKLLKTAGFKSQASLEGLTYERVRNFDKKTIQEIAGLRFIDEGQNILIFGATGVGKTYLATAIGNHTCRSGRPVIFHKLNILFEKIALARAEGTYLNFLKKIYGASLLIIDDFGLRPLTDQQCQDIYDVLSERENERSVIVTTQLPSENWNEVILDPLVCEAISDRLTARSIKLNVKGPSKRGDQRKSLTHEKESEN